MVRCYVLDQVSKNEGVANAKKVIRLSMRGSLINRGLSMKHISAGFPVYGCVVSKEDLGYVVSAGISGTTFFLPTKALPSAKAELVVGQPVECICQDVNEGAQSATLRGHPKAVYEALTRSGNLAFSALIPGMLVNVLVDKVVEVRISRVNAKAFVGCKYHYLDLPDCNTEWCAGDLPGYASRRHRFPLSIAPVLGDRLERRREGGRHHACPHRAGGSRHQECAPVCSPACSGDARSQ